MQERDKEREIQLAREELESEEREKQRAHELKLREIESNEKAELQEVQSEKESNSDTSCEASSGETRKFGCYTQKLNDSQDAYVYFTAFENFARIEGWEKSTWVRRIAQCMLDAR